MAAQRELEKDLDHLREKLHRQELLRPAQDERLRGMGFFEAMVKSLPEAVAVLRQGVHVHCNGAWAHLFGFEASSELAHRTLESLLDPADAPKVLTHLQVDLDGPAPAWALEAKGRTPSGQLLELELTGRAFLQGGTAYVALSARDLRMAKRAEEALRRNEWWWRHMFRMSLVGMAMISVEGRILAANDRLCEILGRSREALLEKSWTELTPAEDLAAEQELFQGLLNGLPREEPYEKRVCNPDGEVVVLVNASAIFRPDGSPEQVLALVQDMTEQREVQGQLSATQNIVRLLGAAVEQSHASVVITDRDGTIQYVNSKFVEITGYSAEEAKGKNPRILKSGLQGPEIYADLWHTLLEGKPWSGQLANRRKDGSLFWEQARISPIVAEGETTHFLAVKEDVTLSRAMEQSHRRLLSALEFTDEAVAVCASEGELIHANNAFHGILGCPCVACPNPDMPPEQCRLHRFFRDTGKEILEAVQAREVTTGQTLRRRATWTRNEGEKPMTLDISVSLVEAPDGLGRDLLIVCRDVTQEQEMESHLRQIEKMEALGTLVSGITHDFNNVLTAIQSAAELIEWQLPEDSPVRSKLSVILQATGRARDLNRQILTFSRPSKERSVPFDLSAVTRECVHLLKNALPKDISIQTAIASSVWVTGDPAQIHQVLMNLTTNAAHAMEGKHGALVIALSEVEGPAAGADGQEELVATRGALLVVRDNGAGMDAATLKRACEPFFSTKEAGKGTGLGLSVVHGIVNRHRGNLTFASIPGEGTEVQVWLPSMANPESAVEATPEEFLKGHGHLLVVDLEGVRIALTKEALQGLGYRVTAKSDPIEALQAFREHPAVYDLVLMEYSVASLSAEELALRIRKLRKDLPVLLVSGSVATQIMTAEEIEQSPFDLVLRKPFGIKELGRAVHALLKDRQVQAPAPVPSAEASAQPGVGRVLIAEDSAVTLSMLKSWMTKAGYSVVTARDGREAWEILEKQGLGTFAMVLSDVVMPRMDGIQLVERIRELDAEIPVVLLSSSEDLDAMKAAVHLHVSEFLAKPFDSLVLLACAGRLLSGAGTRVRSAQTAQAVRMAQKALVAMPEKDLPLYSVHQSLTDAGGDVFRCFRQADGSIFFVLADVAGHSVISSYAVAAFLGLLSSLQASDLGLPELALKLNRGIQHGPFSEVPVCVLMGRWQPTSGRLDLLNAGLPHGIHANRSSGCRRIEINGTPLGIFDDPIVEEKVLFLEEGDRVLFGSDGVFDVHDKNGQIFEDLCKQAWCGTSGMEIAEAVVSMGSLAQSMAESGLSDDLLLVGFAQPAPAASGFRLKLPSTVEAIDLAVFKLEAFLATSPKAIPLTHSRRFDITTAAREALTNALYHGNGGVADKSIWLLARWQEHPPALHLTVVDDGQGFELAALQAPTDALSERGRGIPFLRHCAGRVQMAGGELSLEFRWED
jgi:PAS domain S-box-containing protein